MIFSLFLRSVPLVTEASRGELNIMRHETLAIVPNENAKQPYDQFNSTCSAQEVLVPAYECDEGERGLEPDREDVSANIIA